MTIYTSEPLIYVGLMEDASKACFETIGTFLINSKPFTPGKYTVLFSGERINLLDPDENEITSSKEIIIETESIKEDNTDQMRDIISKEIGSMFRLGRDKYGRFTASQERS